jgi:hypothetical protein
MTFLHHYSAMIAPKKNDPLRRRLREMSREIVWALLLTLLAFGVIALSLMGS